MPELGQDEGVVLERIVGDSMGRRAPGSEKTADPSPAGLPDGLRSRSGAFQPQRYLKGEGLLEPFPT
ncbi:hypothetical protein [Streptomyces sp. TLI_105]|uniref:hypothetical protein n=1 Tax=Streptomyces sp. TLI_105 TaxID=1881019 RepID=UPI00115FDC08|nr:hypothetical protein [Streptomyces sp. TLI_105]